MWFDPALERNLLPDSLIRWGARRMTAKRLREIQSRGIQAHQDNLHQYLEGLRSQPIAVNTTDANQQHYEVPTAFFQQVLGSHMKYSCGYWEKPVSGNQLQALLDPSEEAMLALTCQRAGIADGQKILDLGCGWGSLSLYMARKYPAAEIVAVSNSSTQKAFIDARAEEENLKNLTVITADINDFTHAGGFHRAVSVEMFEHMRNYEALMEKIAGLLLPKGCLFVHIFTHRTTPYAYEAKDEGDWMARHFFTGGTMPSQDLLHYFNRHFSLEQQWAVSGLHYQKTLEAWLQQMDARRETIMPIMAEIQGPKHALKWWVYWRVFFMACAEFFAYNGGNEWYVSHYLFQRR
ncbi:cyclopropane-fatty-acyl-phospholipid synthase family protein [Anoxynatronum sibiricum]|uniref:Cyclopropane-fatty-acyl-phospholipid synthase family protein n=1 Tax=Anoxynatronum sibiricum TaxID=210623 RepID=A0ABU9VW85_9CLOT